jgi:hypothetical protein
MMREMKKYEYLLIILIPFKPLIDDEVVEVDDEVEVEVDLLFPKKNLNQLKRD